MCDRQASQHKTRPLLKVVETFAQLQLTNAPPGALDLGDFGLSDVSAAPVLTTAFHARRLQAMSLARNSALSHETWLKLAGVLLNKECFLKHVCLEGCDLHANGSVDALCLALRNSKRLLSLSVRDCQLWRKGKGSVPDPCRHASAFVALLMSNKALTALDISHNKLPDKWGQKLGSGPHLRFKGG